MSRFKKFTAVLLAVLLSAGVFAGCGNGVEESSGKSKLAWVGTFKLESIELGDSTIHVDDFDAMGWPKNQSVTLNKDYTGKMKVGTDMVRTFDISYSYDLAEQSGYIYAVIDGRTDSYRFEIEGKKLIVELQGAEWTFKK